MNIFAFYEQKIKSLLQEQYPDVEMAKMVAEPTKDAAHGDLATNAAMVLAPQLKTNPKELAAALAPFFAQLPNVAKAEVAGPGFINLTLKPAAWLNLLPGIITDGVDYGHSSIGQGIAVNVEYVSANPTGPMHVGHGRGAVVGDALANLLAKAGYAVTREYYINDAGSQIDKLVQSALLRYKEVAQQAVEPGFTIKIPEGCYPGDYLIPVGKALYIEYGVALLSNAQDVMAEIRSFVVESMMQLIREDLALMGIHHNVFTSERSITEAGKVETALAALQQKGLIYKGVLEAPKGKTPEDWEPRPQTLFKATEFGDDQDRALIKSDESWTYFAPDVAYHFDKCQRGFNILIDIFGADHAGYVKRIKAAVAALSDRRVAIEVKLCQLVKFIRNGEPLKMSKRAGTFVTVREVVDEVGKDVFRFIMLTRKNDAPLDFDFAKVMEQSKDNPVFYVQYAHARAHSVLRHAKAEMPDAFSVSNPNLARLASPQELRLIRFMAGFPRAVEAAAVAYEPHRIAFYLSDLAAEFHSYWNVGNGQTELRFLQKDDVELTAARILLAKAFAIVIAAGLTLLGVEPLEELRA